MRDSFLVITIVFALFGLAFHWLWNIALIAFIAGLCFPPGGVRPDGKRKSSGPLGLFLDYIVISAAMKNCPHCGRKIMKKDAVCYFCHNEAAAGPMPETAEDEATVAQPEITAEPPGETETPHMENEPPNADVT